MSRKSKERQRRLEVPLLVERYEREQQQDGMTYEEAKWARLSPAFRAAHNRLLQARGMPTIPPPKIDLYVPPRLKENVRVFKMDDPETQAAVRAALRPPDGTPMMLPGAEGFEDRGARHAGWRDPE